MPAAQPFLLPRGSSTCRFPFLLHMAISGLSLNVTTLEAKGTLNTPLQHPQRPRYSMILGRRNPATQRRMTESKHSLPICQTRMEWKAQALVVSGLEHARCSYTFLGRDNHVSSSLGERVQLGHNSGHVEIESSDHRKYRGQDNVLDKPLIRCSHQTLNCKKVSKARSSFFKRNFRGLEVRRAFRPKEVLQTHRSMVI